MIIVQKYYPLLFCLILSLTTLAGCKKADASAEADPHIIVTGEMMPVASHKTPLICRVSLASVQTDQAGCGSPKSIEMTFHPNTADITELKITTNLNSLSIDEPGWSSKQPALSCDQQKLQTKQCQVTLTFMPTHEKPESTLYIDYEYRLAKEKELKHDRISVVYTM